MIEGKKSVKSRIEKNEISGNQRQGATTQGRREE